MPRPLGPKGLGPWAWAHGPGPRARAQGPVWWQSHRACGRRAPGAGRRAVAPPQTPLVSPHPPKIAIPLLGGKICPRRSWGGLLGPKGSQGPSGFTCHLPQQGDSNLGWVDGHRWGLSWRDRPPATAAARAQALCDCNTGRLCDCHSRPKGVLAGPGTPRDPKTNLFATKWVAVAPFGTCGLGSYAEFRRGSH